MASIAQRAVVSAPSKSDKKYFGIAETGFKDLKLRKTFWPQKVR